MAIVGAVYAAPWWEKLKATVLLEDLGNVVANRLFDGKVHADAELLGAQIADELEQLANRCKHLVVVGNEVGSDGTYYTRETQEYQQVLGQVARTWTAQCDVATECCCGIPQALKVGGEAAHELPA
jgi:adenosylcobinamide kinase/adenosylcobinamide-phosphate guanylyltransferase